LSRLLIETLYVANEEYIIGIAELYYSENIDVGALISHAEEVDREALAVQFINPECIAGPMHILSAAQNALNAWLGRYAISRSLGVEVLVHSSGQRQIARGLESHGIVDGMDFLGLVVIGRNQESVEKILRETISLVGSDVEPPFLVNEKRFEMIKAHFEVSQEEINLLSEENSDESRSTALSKAVISKVSLVALDS
jgi:tRNA threonylcarbamoyladenosine modification (KEOPS) complex Cgi121 subunit